MKNSPISFKSIDLQNPILQQKLIYQQKADNLLKLSNAGYKRLSGALPLYIDGKYVSGTAFVKESENNIELKITNDKYEVLGKVGAELKNSEAWFNVEEFNNSRKRKDNVATFAYHSLFEYIKANYPKIDVAKVNVTNFDDLIFMTSCCEFEDYRIDRINKKPEDYSSETCLYHKLKAPQYSIWCGGYTTTGVKK